MGVELNVYFYKTAREVYYIIAGERKQTESEEG